MRASAAQPLRFFAALCLVGFIPGSVLADTIYLKSGRKISATHVIEENGQVSYETPSGRLSFPLSIVDHIERDEPSEIFVPGCDRASLTCCSACRPVIRN